MKKRGLLFVIFLLIPSVSALDVNIKNNVLTINGEFSSIINIYYEDNSALIDVIDFTKQCGDIICKGSYSYDLNRINLNLDESYYFNVYDYNEKKTKRFNFGFRGTTSVIGKGLYEICSLNEECASGNCVGPEYHCCPIDRECYLNNKCYDVGEFTSDKNYVCSSLNEFKTCDKYCSEQGLRCENGGCVVAKIAVVGEIKIISVEQKLFQCPDYGPGIQIKWTSLDGADHYRVEYKKVEEEWKKFIDRPLAYNWVNFVQEPNTQDCNIKGEYCKRCIDIGKAYYFRIKAQDKNNNDLTDWSNIVFGAYGEEVDPCEGEGVPCKYGFKGFCTSLFGIKIFAPTLPCKNGCVNGKCIEIEKTAESKNDNYLMNGCVINCDKSKCNQISNLNKKETALEQYIINCNNNLCGKENCARKLVFMYVPEKKTELIFTNKFLKTYECYNGENLKTISGITQEECRNICETYESIPSTTCCSYLEGQDTTGKNPEAKITYAHCTISNAIFLEKNKFYGNYRYSATISNNVNKDIFLGNFETKKICSEKTAIVGEINSKEECRRICQVTFGANCCQYDTKYNSCRVYEGEIKNSNYDYYSAILKEGKI